MFFIFIEFLLVLIIIQVLQKELGELCLAEGVEIYQPLYDMIQVGSLLGN